ncbi:PEP-CTERM sorting domain-containing protein [Scytonema sp. PCC 10023]|uniref:PEP-CTERM sorting domain-containing protein n=1 Tax=Scytonema sp. PCC 10023 TaxID=1680591 RepID=UPI0039C6D246
MTRFQVRKKLRKACSKTTLTGFYVRKKMLKAGTVATFVAVGAGTLGTGQAQAVTIGADAFGYTATDEIPFTFQDISTTGTGVLAGQDDASASANLGFDFNFYGTNYNSASFSTNGLISFVSSNNQFSNQNLTTAVFGDNPSIAVLWDDWQFFSSGTDAVYYQTVGTAGNRQFITQWNLASGFFSSPSTVSFQSVLFEGSNDIVFSYQDLDSGDFRSFGGSATVGIRNVNGQSNGRNLQWSFNSPVIRNGESICFSTSNCSSAEPVPEPLTILGSLAAGGVGAALRRKYKQQQKDTAKV